jgi:hypothetical protein
MVLRNKLLWAGAAYACVVATRGLLAINSYVASHGGYGSGYWCGTGRPWWMRYPYEELAACWLPLGLYALAACCMLSKGVLARALLCVVSALGIWLLLARTAWLIPVMRIGFDTPLLPWIEAACGLIQPLLLVAAVVCVWLAPPLASKHASRRGWIGLP